MTFALQSLLLRLVPLRIRAQYEGYPHLKEHLLCLAALACILFALLNLCVLELFGVFEGPHANAWASGTMLSWTLISITCFCLAARRSG